MPVTGPTGDTRTDEQLIAAFIASPKYSQSQQTRSAYLRYLSEFKRWLHYMHGVTMRDAYRGHITAYWEYLESHHFEGHPGPCTSICEGAPYEGSALWVRKAAIRSFYRFLYVKKVRGDNPCTEDDFDTLPSWGDDSSTRQKDILLPHEIQTYWEYATEGGPHRQLVLALPFAMNLRAEECLSFRLDRSHLETFPKTKRALIKRKGNWMQWVDIPPILWPVIDRYTDGRSSGPLLLTNGRRTRQEDGSLAHTALSYRQFLDLTQAAGTESGVRPRTEGGKGMHPHLGRHTAITLALTETQAISSDGLTVRTSETRVSTWAGHKEPKTTRRYYNNLRLTPGVHRNPLGPDWSCQAL